MGPGPTTTVNSWIYEFTLAGWLEGDYFHDTAFQRLFVLLVKPSFAFWVSDYFAGQTLGFRFPVSDSPENCRLKSIGLKLMDPGGSNLINEYPHRSAENNFKLIDVK